MKLIIAALALVAPATAYAADNVSLDQKVFVQREVPNGAGGTRTVLQTPDETKVTPGDRIVYVFSYHNQGAQAASGFNLVDPVPATVAFAGTDDSSAIVSVDGGKTWGPLPTLKVVQADGTQRNALPTDVTHVRWSFATIPAGQTGKLSFRGVVK